MNMHPNESTPNESISHESVSHESTSSSSGTRPSLVPGLRVGSPQAWERLVAHYQPRLIACCRSRGLDDAATHDVLQEVWVSVARSLPSFSSTTGQGAFRAWLWRIMQRRIIDFRRQQGREPNATGGSTMLGRLARVPANSESDSASSSIACHPNNEDSGQRQLGSHRLPLNAELKQILDRAQMDYEPRTWQAFLRCAMDGHSTEQVALEFKMTAVGVRQLRSRILRRLRRELETQQNER